MNALPMRYFAIFGAMRTGSNLLERSINQFSGLHCHGELFNPAFIGKRNQTELAGYTLSDREQDPQGLIAALAAQDTNTIPGFRIFDGHDRRITQLALQDPSCRRVFLRRDPLDSYVSLKIARKTDQWMLGNVKKRKTAQIIFDPAEYADYCAELSAYHADLRRVMSAAGQTAFEIGYSDLKDMSVLNGLAGYLGSDQVLNKLEEPIKRQNPEPLGQKVENYNEMCASLKSGSATDGTARSTGPVIFRQMMRHFRANTADKLLYAHIPGVDADPVAMWMADSPAQAVAFRNQKALTKWLEATPGAMSFTVVWHPVVRAYHVFCTRILSDGPDNYPHIRKRLADHHGVKLPDPYPVSSEDVAGSFEAFCMFLKANLAEQTGIRIDKDWAPQDALLEALGSVLPVRRVVRADEVGDFCATTRPDAPAIVVGDPSGFPPLEAIYSKRIENLVRAAYARDYRKFGFEAWSGGL